MSDNLSLSGPSWLVVYTDSRAERDVRDEIDKAGFKAFLPMEKRRAKPGRKAQVIEAPLITRYVFARADLHKQDWGELKHIDGVSDVLTNNNTPSRVPTVWIEALMKAEAYGLFDRTTHLPMQFKIGEQVRLGDEAGVFEGHRAVIDEFFEKIVKGRAEKRAKVLAQFMGRLTTLDLPICNLVKL